MEHSSIRAAIEPGILASVRHALTAAVFVGAAGLALAPGLALADETTAPTAGDAAKNATATADMANSTGVSGVEVGGSRQAQADSPKYTAAMVDTPQTITVVPKAVIEAQNLLSLRDILSTVPGITFGAGEAGGGYGDSINLRGYSAASDITVDGVRDSAQYSRSDPFNLEQLEVTNGANGVYAGLGSVGGSINIVSKAPLAHDSIVGSLGAGTDSYGRAILDANKVLTDKIAVRLNAMVHSNDGHGRDVERFSRWGIAPSILYGLGTPTQVSLSDFHQTDDNIPQYGVPFFNGRPVPGINPSTYYGYRNIDIQKTQADSGTFKLDHQFGRGFTLRNLTRYQVVTQHAQVDAPERGYCLANGTKPVGFTQTSTGGVISVNTTTGYLPCVAGDPAPGFFQPSGNRGNVRNSRNTEAYTQLDLSGAFHTGSIEHTFTLGGSYIRETYQLEGGNILRVANGTAAVLPPMTLTNPDNFYAGPQNFIRASIAYGARNNGSLYYFETAKLSPKFEINGGVRYDDNRGVNRTDTYSTVVGATLGSKTVGAPTTNADNLVSYRLGLVYKPVANASFYLAYGDTQTPSQSAVNGACANTATSQTCNLDPEKARNIELGAKWDWNAIALTAAVFRNERTNYKVPSGDPLIPAQALDGSSRVDGVSLGASGKVTKKLALFANYTYLDSIVLRSVSKLTAATVGDLIKGDPLTQTPKNALSLYATYDITKTLQVGYGASYQGAFYLTQHFNVPVAPPPPPTVAPSPAILTNIRSTIPLIQTEAYWVSRLNITYKLDAKTDVRLNINNLFDKEYYTRIRNNGWATPGDTRNLVVTINRRF
jgi:catecholate siderophore receptor